MDDEKHSLVDMMKTLDQALTLMCSRQINPTFANIRQQVQLRLQRAFTINHFRQILAVSPKLYNHHYDNMGGLVITCQHDQQPLSQQAMNVRAAQFMQNMRTFDLVPMATLKEQPTSQGNQHHDLIKGIESKQE